MKSSNNVFIVFEKWFNQVGRQWASWMSKKETGMSNQRKKAYLATFVVVMIALLWLPLFYQTGRKVVDVGSINPPVSLNRNDYQHKVHRMDYLIDSLGVKKTSKSELTR